MTPTRSGSPLPVRLKLAPIAMRQLLEALMAVLDVEVLRGGEPVFLDVQSGRPVPENREAIRVRDRSAAEAAAHWRR